MDPRAASTFPDNDRPGRASGVVMFNVASVKRAERASRYERVEVHRVRVPLLFSPPRANSRDVDDCAHAAFTRERRREHTVREVSRLVPVS